MHKTLKERPKEMSDEDWEILKEEIVTIIRMCLSMNVTNFVANKAVKLMEMLTNGYEKSSANSKAYLLKQYFNM